MVYGWLEGWFVERCPACDGASEAGFCTVCARGFARVTPACRGCGLELPVEHCPRRQSAWHLEAVVAPLHYAPPLDHYVQSFKYRGERALARALALLLAPAIRADGAQVDALVPVPLHRSRLLARGYNQALELARHLGRELDLPLLVHGLARRSADASQTKRGALARRTSVAGAFVVTRRLAPSSRLAIVDDVITTGATANALAAELRAAGAASCVAWAVARTAERPTQPRNV